MRQFIEVSGKDSTCDLCQKKSRKGEKAFLMVDSDSITLLCFKCGDYIWAMVDSTIILFQHAIKKNSQTNIHQPRKREVSG